MRYPLSALPGNTAFMSYPQSGDILISVRKLDLIAVVSQDPAEISWWWGPGELSGQHQPTLLANRNLLVFDNGAATQRSRILEFDPGTRSIVWESSVPFFTLSGGGNEKLANGNILVTDSDSGHVFELGKNEEVVWEYWNPVLASENEDLRRRPIYRMSRVDCEYFAQSREPNPAARCAR